MHPAIVCCDPEVKIGAGCLYLFDAILKAPQPPPDSCLWTLRQGRRIVRPKSFKPRGAEAFNRLNFRLVDRVAFGRFLGQIIGNNLLKRCLRVIGNKEQHAPLIIFFDLRRTASDALPFHIQGIGLRPFSKDNFDDRAFGTRQPRIVGTQSLRHCQRGGQFPSQAATVLPSLARRADDVGAGACVLLRDLTSRDVDMRKIETRGHASRAFFVEKGQTHGVPLFEATDKGRLAQTITLIQNCRLNRVVRRPNNLRLAKPLSRRNNLFP